MNRISIVASALGSDPRQVPRNARQLGFSGLVFDAFSSLLNLTELSQTGRREFLHLLSAENQQLIALQLDLGPKGMGLSADIDRQIERLDRAMESAAGLRAPLVLVDLGSVPEPAVENISPPAPKPQDLGVLILPAASPPKPVRVLPPSDPKFVAQVDSALAEIAIRAERYSVMVGFSSSLASFAALSNVLGHARCHWFGIDLDTSALLRDDWSADEIFSTIGASIRHVRARDAVAGADKRTKPTVIGQGSLNWNQVLALFDEAGYAGSITIDPTELSDRGAAAIAGLAHLRSLAR